MTHKDSQEKADETLAQNDIDQAELRDPAQEKADLEEDIGT